MTRAPENLLTARRLLLDYLGPDARPRPGVVILDRLDGAELGVIGDASHRGGYHCGSDRTVANDYSVVESPRDRRGLTLDAAALDVGYFRVRTPAGTFDLRHYSRWLVGQCERNAPDTVHLREVIYSPDGEVVRRWDRLRRRTSGDSSHRRHTHESYFRDAVKAGYDVTAVKRRYLVGIGVVKPVPAPTPEVPDVELSDKISGTDNPNRTVGDVLADVANLRNALVTPVGKYGGPGAPAAGSPAALLGGLGVALDQLRSEQAEQRRLLEGIAARLPEVGA